MKVIIDDFSAEIKMSADEAKSICRLGKGEECCAFLTVGADGFTCIRMSHPANSSIFSRLENGTMNAKGRGGWSGCGWEGQLE